MAMPTVQIVPESKQQASLQTLSLAFSADPFMRWMFSNAEQYLAYFPRVVSRMAGSAFGHGSAGKNGVF